MRNSVLNAFPRRAFTLVELIIVIVIVGILAAISIVGYQSVVDRVDQAATETTLASVDREYRALAAFNTAVDSTAGVPIADMTAIDGIDYTAGDTDSDGLLEPGETVVYKGVILTLTAASEAGSISVPPFSVSYSQQYFNSASSSQTLSPTVFGADGPVTYSIMSGTLPVGVSFDTTTGEFTSSVTWNASAAAVSTGTLHTCALLSGGTVECWGSNDYGQSSPPSSLAAATAVVVGGDHTCALLSDGAVYCWGLSDNLQAAAPTSITDATAVSAGLKFTCALLSDGTVRCWGTNDFGQTAVPSTLANVTSFDAGGNHSCALLSDGTVSCWGRDDHGQSTPPATLANVTAIHAGDNYTCALLAGGAVDCWGLNDDNQASPPAALGNDGFPATIMVGATDGTNTATASVNLSVS